MVEKGRYVVHILITKMDKAHQFLAATGQLYKSVCRSVGLSVALVGWSVGQFCLAFLASLGAVAAYEV